MHISLVVSTLYDVKRADLDGKPRFGGEFSTDREGKRLATAVIHLLSCTHNNCSVYMTADATCSCLFNNLSHLALTADEAMLLFPASSLTADGFRVSFICCHSGICCHETGG
jgi:hypothetical protein